MTMSDLLSKIQLSDPLKANSANLYDVPLTRLDCKFGVVSSRDTMPLKQALHQHAKANNTKVVVMYAVRDASCSSCREHGLQLSDLSAKSRQFALVGVVKETGIHDEGILAFYQDYFRGNAIFLDKKWNIYRALATSPFSLVRHVVGYIAAFKRLHEKGVVSGRKASSSCQMQGGILVFDRDGELRFAVQEVDFIELDLNLVSAAVEETRRLYKLEKANRKLLNCDFSETTDTTSMSEEIVREEPSEPNLPELPRKANEWLI